MEEMGLQPMSFDEVKAQALAGMATGGRAGYYAGGQSIPSEYTMEDARKTGEYTGYDESDVAEAKLRIQQRKDKLETSKKTVMLVELNRVYNNYFSEDDKKRFNDVFIKFNDGLFFGKFLK